jgi:hypothetical protein
LHNDHGPGCSMQYSRACVSHENWQFDQDVVDSG